MIKKCGGCSRPIVKDGGCNKVRCQCGRLICDVCGKDITRAAYDHFAVEGGGIARANKGACPLYDDTARRWEKDAQEAEAIAMKKIRQENPHISEEDLKIKFKDVVQAGSGSPMPRLARIVGFPPEIPIMPGAYPVDLPQFHEPVFDPHAPGPRNAVGYMGYPYAAPLPPIIQHLINVPPAPGLMPPIVGNFEPRRRHIPVFQPPQPYNQENRAPYEVRYHRPQREGPGVVLRAAEPVAAVGPTGRVGMNRGALQGGRQQRDINAAAVRLARGQLQERPESVRKERRR